MSIVENLFVVYPEIILMGGAALALLSSVFFRQGARFSYAISLLTLLIALWANLHFYFGEITSALYGAVILDRAVMVLKAGILSAVLITFIYARTYLESHKMAQAEFYVLALLSTLGMLVLVSSGNLLVLYLGLELLSLPIYAMVALKRDDQRAVEAAMKYFVLGALASGVFLFGVSFLFGATRQIAFAGMTSAILVGQVHAHLMLVFALVFIIAGLIFKIGAAPFHQWVPDIYEGAPLPVVLFISSAPKIAAVGMAVRLLLGAMPALHIDWQQILIVASVLSMGIGNILAITQTNIKRMLAYSSIAHMGYMLLGLICNTPRGFSAAVFYVLTYAVTSLGAFGLLVLLSRDSEVTEVKDLAGLHYRSHWFAFMMLLIAFSMAGIPPMIGFMAKLSLLEALIDVHLTWLAVLAIVFAVIGSYYYIRIVKVMYFEKPTVTTPIRCSLEQRVLVSINGCAVFVLGVLPGFLFVVTRTLF